MELQPFQGDVMQSGYIKEFVSTCTCRVVILLLMD